MMDARAQDLLEAKERREAEDRETDAVILRLHGEGLPNLSISARTNVGLKRIRRVLQEHGLTKNAPTDGIESWRRRGFREGRRR